MVKYGASPKKTRRPPPSRFEGHAAPARFKPHCAQCLRRGAHRFPRARSDEFAARSHVQGVSARGRCCSRSASVVYRGGALEHVSFCARPTPVPIFFKLSICHALTLDQCETNKKLKNQGCPRAEMWAPPIGQRRRVDRSARAGRDMQRYRTYGRPSSEWRQQHARAPTSAHRTTGSCHDHTPHNKGGTKTPRLP